MANMTEAHAQRLLELSGAVPPRARGDAADVERSLEQLIAAEEFRRGDPDPISGAQHVYALTQGALLRREYDLSTHGHWEGWEIGAVVVDIRRLILVNQEHGFPAGDAVLHAVASTLKETFPTGRVVRIHSDAFAVLLPPSAERLVDVALEAEARSALGAGVPAKLTEAGHPAIPLEYTISLLHLTIAKPSHWQVLGPLVWAECERAHTMTTGGQASGVQMRRIELDAAVPITHAQPS